MSVHSFSLASIKLFAFLYLDWGEGLNVRDLRNFFASPEKILFSPLRKNYLKQGNKWKKKKIPKVAFSELCLDPESERF